MESIDDLLAQVKAEYSDSPPNQTQSAKQQNPQPSPPAPSSSGSSTTRPISSAGIDGLLAELGSEYQEQDRLETAKQREREAQARRQQEQQRQQQRQALKQTAQTWLKNLDRHTGEGLWFTEFAQGYACELEAAIDYLEALKEVRS